MKTFSRNINPSPHYPRPPAPSPTPRAAGAQLCKEITQSITQLKLMRLALDRVDHDVELTGTVSCDSIEFVRSVKGLIA